MKNPLSSDFTIGFLGAGQLARMSALEAFRYGMQVAVFSDRPEDEPVQFMTPHSFTGSFSRVEDMIEFAKACDVITLENEFIDSEVLLRLQEASGTPIFPDPRSFALIENKRIEKETFEKAGIPVTPYAVVENAADLKAFGLKYGWPFLLKSSKGGYDGYGNKTVHNTEEAEEAFRKLGGDKGREILAEGFVNFTHELAVQVARNEHGHVVYPCCETIQKNHICVAVKSPAPIPEEIQKKAQQLAVAATEAINGKGAGDFTAPIPEEIQKKAQQLAVAATEAINGKGIFAYEFFLTTEGELLLNESAPRPHNSGHYTIEGALTSQFENHVRAVCGLPPGSAEMTAPHAAMINLLGTDDRSARIDHAEEALLEKDGHLHFYGKLSSKPGRKMAHYTLLGEDASVYDRAASLTGKIRI